MTRSSAIRPAARYDRVRVLKIGSSSARHVLVLLAGTSAGAGYFVPMAEDLVAALHGWQVWAVDRRENLLEDHSVLDRARSEQRLPRRGGSVPRADPLTRGTREERNIMKIVVIGGSGRIGSNAVRRLDARGHDAVPASPATGVDSISGNGLADVMAGADVVVDVANAPAWDDDAVLEFFTTSTRNLMAAERDAGVSHHLAVSIVGADLLPDSGYLRAKIAQEAEVEAGGIPYTILRATQFFEFLPQIVEEGAEGAGVRLSTGLMQLVAADDVAATVAELAAGAPAGGRVELGGPEALGVDAWARRLFAATGDERTVVGDPHGRYFGTELHGGELTPGDGARVGTIDFDTWFASHRLQARRA
jgi:uncharacterized protein YbjT (DUF2867 family)